jgi:hypothetical protein
VPRGPIVCVLQGSSGEANGLREGPRWRRGCVRAEVLIGASGRASDAQTVSDGAHAGGMFRRADSGVPLGGATHDP